MSLRSLPLRRMSSLTDGPIAVSIRTKLQALLSPSHLDIVNESHKHAGHAGNPGGGPAAETHFRVEVVSTAFEGKPLVARHRVIYEALAQELGTGGVHALALKTRTPAEVPRPAA